MSIKIEKLSFAYNEGTPFEVWALKDIDLQIEDGEFLGIIGPSGSGKTTLAQQINGLLKPTKGEISINGVKPQDTHRKIGLVFQSPEDQFFGQTVYKEIVIDHQFETRLPQVLEMVGLLPEILTRSSHSLSDGEKRKVAIASVLILEPKVLILDEPTLYLDPMATEEILNRIKRLNLEQGITVILISNNKMEEVLRFCTRVVTMDKGRIILDGPPKELFINAVDTLSRIGLESPWLIKFLAQFRKRGYNIDPDPSDPDQVARKVTEVLQK